MEESCSKKNTVGGRVSLVRQENPKDLVQRVLWKQQGVLQELLHDYLSFLLSQQGPLAQFLHRKRTRMNYKAHALLL